MSVARQVRDLIKTRGHITIDEIMDIALAADHNSYYRTKKNSIGLHGDFITAPTICQLFGEIIGLWAIEKWYQLGTPARFSLVELGPGHGLLMRDLLKVAQSVPRFFHGADIFLIEINRHFIKKQAAILKSYDKQIKWLSKTYDLPDSPAIIIANEFFDALPIKQYVKSAERWYEVVFTLFPSGKNYEYSKIAVSSELTESLNRLHPEAGEGAIIEEANIANNIMSFLVNLVKTCQGAGLIIDYGYNIAPENNFSRHFSNDFSRQYNSTLQAVKNHKYVSVTSDLGVSDLSSHVNFYKLEKSARNSGLKTIYRSQHRFLLDYGIMLRLQQLQQLNQSDAEILKNQVQRLIDNKQMGQLFKVLEFF